MHNVAAVKNQQVTFDVILAHRNVRNVTRFPTAFGSVVNELVNVNLGVHLYIQMVYQNREFISPRQEVFSEIR